MLQDTQQTCLTDMTGTHDTKNVALIVAAEAKPSFVHCAWQQCDAWPVLLNLSATNNTIGGRDLPDG